MDKEKKNKGDIDAVIDRMHDRLQGLGYTNIAKELPLLEIDPEQPMTCKLAALEGNEVVIFCYPVNVGLAQKVATQDEGVFWSRLIKGERIAHLVWISDGQFDYYFDNNKNTSIAELPEKANWQSAKRGMSDDRKKHLIELSEEFARGNWRFI